jgi:hypothetical protein
VLVVIVIELAIDVHYERGLLPVECAEEVKESQESSDVVARLIERTRVGVGIGNQQLDDLLSSCNKRITFSNHSNMQAAGEQAVVHQLSIRRTCENESTASPAGQPWDRRCDGERSRACDRRAGPPGELAQAGPRCRRRLPLQEIREKGSG